MPGRAIRPGTKNVLPRLQLARLVANVQERIVVTTRTRTRAEEARVPRIGLLRGKFTREAIRENRAAWIEKSSQPDKPIIARGNESAEHHTAAQPGAHDLPTPLH